MYIEQLYTKPLSASAYYIESGKEAAVIDPILDVQPYLDLAERRNTKIRFVLATHFQSDHVSGCLELSRRTGAQLVYGPGATADFPLHAAADGEEFRIGFLSFRVLHTPGHTPESVCYLLLDDRNNPHSIFTGDTLFVDDVGRPDLFSESKKETIKQAGILYDSLHQKLMPLANYVVVYPGHGAGSPCGKMIGKDRHSTMGMQRNSNYALKAATRNEFVSQVIENSGEPPAYFKRVGAMNRSIIEPLDKILERNLNPMSAGQFMAAMLQRGHTVIDTRDAEAFSQAHLPGSVFIGREGNFEISAALVLQPDDKLLVVCDPGKEKEVFTRLAIIGFGNVSGYLEGGLNAWVKTGASVESMENIAAEHVAGRFRYNTDIIVDVRNPSEWIPGIIAGAKLISLQYLDENISNLDRKKNIFVYCSSGYRSMIAASILKRKGFSRVINVKGGMQQMKQTPIPVRQLSRIG